VSENISTTVKLQSQIYVFQSLFLLRWKIWLKAASVTERNWWKQSCSSTCI